MVKKLEDKIIDKVYRFETRHTLYKILTTLGAILFFSILSVGAGIIVIRQLTEQQTWDLLELFSEDWEIIRTYLWDTIVEFYNELPKTETMFLVLMIVITLILIVIAIKRSRKIKNKIHAIFSYWHIKN